MKNGVPLLMALFLAFACGKGEPIPSQDLLIRVRIPDGEQEFGKAFPLEVIRVWNKMLTPEPWSDPSLVPLLVRPESVTQREDAERIEETRRFAGYAFQMGEIRIEGLDFSARMKNSEKEQKVSCDPLVLHVRAALTAEEENTPPELPGKLLREPFPWKGWILGLCLPVLLVGSFLGYRYRRKALRETEPESEAPPPPHVHARERIETLRASHPREHDEIQAFYVEASLLVRDYIEERFAVHAPGMTTEELSNAMDAELFRTLSDLMTHCDFVKFGRFASTPEDRTRLLDTASRFIEKTYQDLSSDGEGSAKSFTEREAP